MAPLPSAAVEAAHKAVMTAVSDCLVDFEAEVANHGTVRAVPLHAALRLLADDVLEMGVEAGRADALAKAHAEHWLLTVEAPAGLSDEDLAAVNRLHDITHPHTGDAGVLEPKRNPGGCDKAFCCAILSEVIGTVDAAIRADERARIRSLLPYNHNCCGGFPAAVADLIGEHGD